MIFYRRISSTQDPNLSIVVKETMEPGFGLYLWPSAIVLTLYILQNRSQFTQKRITEIGAGVGLVGMMLAKLGATVTLTDAATNTKILENLKHSTQLNQLTCKVAALDFGQTDTHARDLFTCDIVIASDVFYDVKDFEALVCSIFLFVQQSPSGVFVTAYQERSSKRSLQPLLDRWGLVGQLHEFPLDQIYDGVEHDILIEQGFEVNFLKKQAYQDRALASVFIISIRKKP